MKGKISNLQIALLIFMLILVLAGCSNNTRSDAEAQALPQKISSEEAKAMMDQGGVIVLDVRTQQEFDEGHIQDAVLLPNDQILENAESVLTDKEATILVYCRSGNRSAQASKDLSTMGYVKVYDFGGIKDWPYEVVK